MSIRRSRTNMTSGRPALRYAEVGAVLVRTPTPAHMRDRDVIDAGRDRDPLGQRHERDRTRPEIAGVYRAQGEEVSALVERKFGFRSQIAAVEIGKKRLAPIAHPFDRASDA